MFSAQCSVFTAHLLLGQLACRTSTRAPDTTGEDVLAVAAMFGKRDLPLLEIAMSSARAPNTRNG
jgi:hypothetical protein